MKIIKVMPEYGCSSIWELNNEGFFEPTDVYELNIELSDSLKETIITWQKKYESTYYQENPIESGFKSEEEEENFEKEGFVIWNKLSKELPEFEVNYFSIKENELYKSRG